MDELNESHICIWSDVDDGYEECVECGRVRRCRRNGVAGTTGTRFEVSRDHALVGHAATLMDAVALAKGADGTEIFDRMARKGQCELWRMQSGFAARIRVRSAS